MRIYSWRDFADSPTTSDIKIPAWTVSDRGSMSCPSPDGHDICKRADSRILNGWFRNGIMGFLWNVAQGNGYPFPHLHSIAFKVNPVSNSITVDSSPIIWSDKHGIVYGFAPPDITGLGIVAYWSGGGFFPQLRAAIAGVPVIGPGTFSINFAPTSMDLLGSSTNAPAANEWGDYLRIRSCGGIGFGGYVVSGVTMLGTKEVGTGDKSDSIFPNFYIFGNQILPGFTGALPCGLRTINGTTSGITTTSALTELSSAPSSPGSEQLVCADGTAPDATTGLCADGSQPQPQSQSFNATAPGVTTPEQQLVCADGTGPDATTGLCADGSQPQPQSQSFNATAPGVTTPEQQLVCADGTGPDPTTGLCADGSQPQPQPQPQSQSFNATAPGVTTPEQQLVCADGTAPDPTTGLCADGSQPQSQSFNATAPGVTTPEQQLVCADGYWTRSHHRPLC